MSVVDPPLTVKGTNGPIDVEVEDEKGTGCLTGFMISVLGNIVGKVTT